MAFINFAARASGSNLNSGTRTGNTTQPGTAADFTYASGTWVQSTRTFTRLDAGDFVADGLTTNDFISVYPDGSSTGVYIAQVTTVTTTTFVTSASISAGTAPTNGTATRTAKLGGAWLGPNGTDTFPFSLGELYGLSNSGLNGSLRINLKNDQTYSITANIASSATSTTVQGYTSSFGDLGRATIDGGTSNITLFTQSGNSSNFFDLIFSNNGTGTAIHGLSITGSRSCITRCVFHDLRGNGFLSSNLDTYLTECEAYACNSSNTSGQGGFNLIYGTALRCISHDNTGSNSFGFNSADIGTFVNCISDTNGGIGFQTSNTTGTMLVGCDSYNNTSHGINITGAYFNPIIDSCNLVKNGGYGINFTNISTGGIISNCGFGAGTQVNTSGTINFGGGGTFEIGSVNYASNVTPWVDPANGDFRINLAAAINAGRGTFTQTAASYAGTIGYPDIGAAQALSGSSGVKYLDGIRGNLE